MNRKESEGEGQQLVETGEGANKGAAMVGSGSPAEAAVLTQTVNKVAALLEGIRLIFASTYLLHICAFLWLTAVISSFFYFEVRMFISIIAICFICVHLIVVSLYFFLLSSVKVYLLMIQNMYIM